ncbi:MAG: 2-isopropylmalate synthase [Rhodospirillaceae bacterium]|nr:MAG: 2-isopropylmalate synthase [Rhodospirillaceae bacterium]
MRQVLFCDTTLHDGEQSPGVNLFPEEKLAVACQLVKLGIPIIEAGSAATSHSDWEGGHRVAQEVGGHGGPIICSMARAHLAARFADKTP